MRALTNDERDRAATCVLLAWKLAHRAARGLSQAESEAIQDTAIWALVYSASRYDPSRGIKFTTYAGNLISLCVRPARVRSRMGKRSVHCGRLREEPPAKGTCSASEAAEEVRAIIGDAGLSPTEMRVVRLRYFEGLTPDETAKLTGFPARSVISQTHNAIRKLKAVAKLRGDLETK